MKKRIKMQLKGEMSMLNVLRLQELDVTVICTELEQKRDEAPQFFMQSPVVVDCAGLGENDIVEFDFVALKKGLLELGFVPVGVRNFPASLNVSLAESGWAIMRTQQSGASSKPDVASENPNQQKPNDEKTQEPTNPTPQISFARSMTVDRPVRSGQQVYAANADMTVLAPTSAGSEIMADGSIHIYGALRGRVLAGAQGNESARIYCQCLQAELVAIAGRYQLLDELNTNLIGKPAMIRLEGEKLIVEALT